MTTEERGDREETGRLSPRRARHCPKTPSFGVCGNCFGVRTSIKFSAPTARTLCLAVGESKYHPLYQQRKISSFMYSKLAAPGRPDKGERNFWMASIFRVQPSSEVPPCCSVQQVLWSVPG